MLIDEEIIRRKVNHYFFVDRINWATAVLKLLEEVYSIKLHPQVFHSSLGMNGAGRYGAQCGLVEGFLMFIGIWSRQNQVSDEDGKRACFDFASFFECNFNSLLCKELRPCALSKAKNPDHPCEELKVRAMVLGLQYIEKLHRASQS